MSLKLPYYSSLNSQMAEYYKQVKLQEYNDLYQQAQLDIVLEGQRNLASQAEIMNRLTQLQQEIANQAVQTLIPLSATNAPVSKISSKIAKKLPTPFEEKQAMQSEDLATKYQNKYKKVVEEAKQKKNIKEEIEKTKEEVKQLKERVAMQSEDKKRSKNKNKRNPKGSIFY